ncbi:MAG: segregation and condensation protein A [Caulobacteraceae bacterium]
MSLDDDPGELVIDLDGYEGPLDLLLDLARRQKIDLSKLSVTRLADQYLAFVRRARWRDFELAADYLVMASWLAWLKSKLLLPGGARDAKEPQAAAAARALAWRLSRLAAVREAAEALERRDVAGRDVFLHGETAAMVLVPSTRLAGDLTELMAAYVEQRRKSEARRYSPTPARSYPLDDARARLRRLLPELKRWTALTGIAPFEERAKPGPTRASFVASTLSASLELVREGAMETRQTAAFAEVWLRSRPSA